MQNGITKSCFLKIESSSFCWKAISLLKIVVETVTIKATQMKNREGNNETKNVENMLCCFDSGSVLHGNCRWLWKSKLNRNAAIQGGHCAGVSRLWFGGRRKRNLRAAQRTK